MTIDANFIESLVARGRGYRVIEKHLNHRFQFDWEDVYQDALLVLWRNRRRLRNSKSALPYFYGVVRNTCLSYRETRMDRADYCELKAEDAVLWPHGLPESVHREYEIERAQQQMEELLRKVPTRYRNAYWKWRERGYRNVTPAQRTEFSRMIGALFGAAGRPPTRHPHFSVRAGHE